MRCRRVHRRRGMIKGEKYETHEPAKEGQKDGDDDKPREEEEEDGEEDGEDGGAKRGATREGRAMSADLSIDHLDYWTG